jgi:hypothetical protein
MILDEYVDFSGFCGMNFLRLPARLHESEAQYSSAYIRVYRWFTTLKYHRLALSTQRDIYNHVDCVIAWRTLLLLDKCIPAYFAEIRKVFRLIHMQL